MCILDKFYKHDCKWIAIDLAALEEAAKFLDLTEHHMSNTDEWKQRRSDDTIAVKVLDSGNYWGNPKHFKPANTLSR